MKKPVSAYERKWRHRAEVVGKFALYGGLFAGGALIIGELIGPTVARRLGEAGGEGFAQGMAQFKDALSSRGRRFS